MFPVKKRRPPTPRSSEHTVCFVVDTGCDTRTGAATTDALSSQMGTITMASQIFLGGRMDLEHDRHFKGKLAS